MENRSREISQEQEVAARADGEEGTRKGRIPEQVSQVLYVVIFRIAGAEHLHVEGVQQAEIFMLRNDLQGTA